MRLIDVDELKERLGIADKCDNCSDKMRSYCDENPSFALTCELICKAPTVDAVPVKSIEQIKWERDTAIEQLEEHGISFGCKADVVPVVRCKDCAKRGTINCDLDYCGYRQADDWYCADGESLEDDDLPMCANHYGERADDAVD